MLVAIAPTMAFAESFEYTEDFNLFGQQKNFTCPGPGAGGVCAAIASINSFAFLEAKYPSVYGTNLLPNYDPISKTDMKDAMDFAVSGWKEPSFAHTDDTPTADSDKGYYTRFLPVASGGDGATDANLTFLQTKTDWFSDHVPSDTTRFAMYLTPTVAQLAFEIQSQEDVEFFVKDKVTPAEEAAEGETDEGPEPGVPPGTPPTAEPPEEGEEFYHALTLTAIKCDAATPPNCSIRYQDPNAPTVNQPYTPLTLNGGRLEFTGVPGSLFAGTVFIDAAFAESPAPEPASLVLLGTGIVGLFMKRARSRRRAVHSQTL